MIKQRIRRWLGIEDPAWDKILKQVDQLQADNKEFTEEMLEKLAELRKFVSQIVEVKCDNCGRKFLLWPFGGGYYTEHDGKRFHSEKCLDEYLSKQKKAKVKK